MPKALGSTGKLAIAKASTWLTAVSLGTNHRTPFKSTTLDYQREQIENDDISGRGVRQSSVAGNSFNDGNVVISGDFRQMQHLVLAALFMGAASRTEEDVGTTYLHTLKYQPHTDGLFLSAGVDYGGADVYGFASLKPTRRLIQIAAGGYMEETYDFLGGGIDKTIASSGWTYRTDPTDGGKLPILASQMTCRFNVQTAGALGSGDNVYPTRVEIDMNRALDQEYAQQGAPEEPQSSTWQTIGLRLTFLGMDASLLALFRDNRDDDVALKGSIEIAHPTVLGGGLTRERNFWLPKLKVTDCPNSIPGPGRIPMTVAMTAHVASAAPTGFPTGYLEEIVEEWQNEHDVDPLA